MNAHPPRVRWHVETYDPTAAEWPRGWRYPDRQAAVRKLTHLTTHEATWPDGTAQQHRIVLETTTFQDLTTEPGPLRFPKGGFVLTDHAEQDLGAVPGQTPDGRPAVRIVVGSYEVGHAESTVPLDRLEEVIAGLREIARQQGGQPTPGRRRLTEAEHDRAWHAIEGAAGEDGADPGTVLAAVLRALGIDSPAVLPGMPLTDALRAHAAAVLPPGARITAQALRQAEEAGA